MKDPSNKTTEPTNVEFAQEFGDVNSYKIFEYPFMNQNNAKTKKEEKMNKQANLPACLFFPY